MPFHISDLTASTMSELLEGARVPSFAKLTDAAKADFAQRVGIVIGDYDGRQYIQATDIIIVDPESLDILCSVAATPSPSALVNRETGMILTAKEWEAKTKAALKEWIEKNGEFAEQCIRICDRNKQWKLSTDYGVKFRGYIPALEKSVTLDKKILKGIEGDRLIGLSPEGYHQLEQKHERRMARLVEDVDWLLERVAELEDRLATRKRGGEEGDYTPPKRMRRANAMDEEQLRHVHVSGGVHSPNYVPPKK